MNKTAFVAFYTVYPSNMGSSEVSSSFFETWSGDKKIFQISHLKKINNKKIFTCFIKKENPFYKISKIFHPITKKKIKLIKLMRIVILKKFHIHFNLIQVLAIYKIIMILKH